MQTASTTQQGGPREDEDYAALLAHLRSAASRRERPLFTTDAGGLYDAFLEALPAGRRQHYVCRTCRHFVERYGGLVEIDETGAVSPLFWGWTPPPFFSSAVHEMARIVSKARVTGVFLSSDPVLGNPENSSPKSPTGTWRHMHTSLGANRRSFVKLGGTQTADQVMADKHEDYGTLCRGLAEFPILLVRQAHTLLTTGGLYRSEKCIGVAKWLLDLHEARASTKHRMTREHITWRAVALAPPGFCHVRSTMIGTLLADLAAGGDFEDIKRSFDLKMNPLRYQRPQAAPTDGQLAAAEKVVAGLASAGSLERRFATLEDIADDAVWMPKARVEAPQGGGVFSHLKSGARPAPTIDVPAQIITWDKFWRIVLPEAERIECLVPRGLAAFFAFVTATNMEAPPILQWDRENARNPVNWYLYAKGSFATQWGLTAGTWAPVTAITTQPSSWGGGGGHHGNGVYIVLDGARDQKSSGLDLFPETLKAEYHAVRAAIEAYSRSREISGADRASACGLALQQSAERWQGVLRVTSRGARVVYKLDRWD